MLKSKLKQWLLCIDTKRILDDLHNLGIACIGVGCAGLFLDAYPEYEDGRFIIFILFGFISWSVGLLKRGNKL